MLQSLFGDLGSAIEPSGKKRRTASETDQGFAATSVLESVAQALNEQGQLVDRHVRDLTVSGSPAQAIRDHFKATRADLDTASHLITLLDPARVWATSVIKAVSDAGGQPVEKLHLREQTTLRTLAMIERTALVRRAEDALKIYHADVRAPGLENAEIPLALMERSQLTVVIVGPMEAHAVDSLLKWLNDATAQSNWSCPHLLFMLPPSAVWIASKVNSMAWPPMLHVHVHNESLTSASSVWNALLGTWNHIRSQPDWEPSISPAAEFAVEVTDITEPASVELAGARVAATADIQHPLPPIRTGAQALPRSVHKLLDHAQAMRQLAQMSTLEGLLGCAVVDLGNGLILAREAPDASALDLDLAAAACTQAFKAHKSAARNMGMSDPIEEIMTSAGARHQVMRQLSNYPDLFLFAVLDRQQTNLALARYKLMEIEREMV